MGPPNARHCNTTKVKTTASIPTAVDNDTGDQDLGHIHRAGGD
jgi:hypothetical protein